MDKPCILLGQVDNLDIDLSEARYIIGKGIEDVKQFGESIVDVNKVANIATMTDIDLTTGKVKYGDKETTVNVTMPEIDVDTEMSDESTNPVQNKVIKKYVDDNASHTSETIELTSLIGSLTNEQLEILLKSDNNVIEYSNTIYKLASKTVDNSNNVTALKYTDGNSTNGSICGVITINVGSKGYRINEYINIYSPFYVGQKGDLLKSTTNRTAERLPRGVKGQVLTCTDDDIEWQDAQGGGYIDTEMSDTSENAVQNKVIKEYADTKLEKKTNSNPYVNQIYAIDKDGNQILLPTNTNGTSSVTGGARVIQSDNGGAVWIDTPRKGVFSNTAATTLFVKENAIIYTAAQSLTDAQKQQAKDNLGIVETTQIPETIKSSKQYLSTINPDIIYQYVTFKGVVYNMYSGGIWTDGFDIYYSQQGVQKKLDIATKTWNDIEWNVYGGGTGTVTPQYKISPDYIWTDGQRTYFTWWDGNSTYAKDIGQDTFTLTTKYTFPSKSLSGIGKYSWTDGDDLYFDNWATSQHYKLDKSTNTWVENSWNIDSVIQGQDIWTDGVNVFCSISSNDAYTHYKLDKENKTFNQVTFSGFNDFEGSNIWTDGSNVYMAKNDIYLVDGTNLALTLIRQNAGLNSAQDIWTDGSNIYYWRGGSESQYMLTIPKLKSLKPLVGEKYGAFETGGGSSEDAASLSGDNKFTGSNTFAGETTFSNGLDAGNNITVTNAVFKALDNTDNKDIVTQYAADEIVRETGTGEDKQTYNYKFPDKSGTLVTTEDVSYLTLPPYIEITPASAVNGTLDQDDYDILSEHHDVQIKLNNEYYICMDDGSTEGLMSYIHEGWNGKANQTKSINITKATRAWTLIIGSNECYEHHIQLTADSKTFHYSFVSSKKDAYTSTTLPVMPDNVIVPIQVVASGYYSSISGLVYRNGEGDLKIIVHGMYTSNGTSMSYLALTGADATFVSDTVVVL